MAAYGNRGLRAKDTVTIVTGGGRGIGRGIVNVFAQHGANVVIADINETVAIETEKAVHENGIGQALFIRCDVTQKEDIMRLVDMTMERFGRIDCLINNAGVCIEGDTDTFDLELVNRMTALNIVAPFLVSQVCLPYLRKVKGNIINIASISADGHRSAVIYSATKAASIGFTKSLAAEEGPNGVRVNGIAPGPVHTELLDSILETASEKMVNFTKYESNVLGRMGQPEEIGMACLFLAADATYSTGAILNCTGGSEIDYGVKTGPNHYSSF